MKKSKLNEIQGVLVTAGRSDLAEVLSRSPLSNIPKPERKENEEQKQQKRDNETKRYHEMSPVQKTKKAKRRKEIDNKNEEDCKLHEKQKKEQALHS